MSGAWRNCEIAAEGAYSDMHGFAEGTALDEKPHCTPLRLVHGPRVVTRDG
jgi:hypothetical protein